MLGSSKVDPRIRNTDGDQAIHVAAQNGFFGITKIFLTDSRIDLHARKEGMDWAVRLKQPLVASLIRRDLASRANKLLGSLG
jgi:ankyrin repeat protein